jgi:hypothetical protein
MKRILLSGAFGTAVLVAGLLFSQPTVMKTRTTVWADEGGVCSLARVAGNYGFTLSGTLITPTGGVPVAGVGLATISEAGNFSGTENRSVGGGVAQETLGETISVNSDCTGTLTAPVFESGQLVRTSVFSVVFDDNAKELRAIQTSLVLPNGTSVPNVITAEGRKIGLAAE